MSLTYESVKQEMQPRIEKETRKSLRKLLSDENTDRKTFKAMMQEMDRIKVCYTQAVSKIFEETEDQTRLSGLVHYPGYKDREHD